jgi:hypothetical protein
MYVTYKIEVRYEGDAVTRIEVRYIATPNSY